MKNGLYIEIKVIWGSCAVLISANSGIPGALRQRRKNATLNAIYLPKLALARVVDNSLNRLPRDYIIDDKFMWQTRSKQSVGEFTEARIKYYCVIGDSNTENDCVQGRSQSWNTITTNSLLGETKVVVRFCEIWFLALAQHFRFDDKYVCSINAQ